MLYSLINYGSFSSSPSLIPEYSTDICGHKLQAEHSGGKLQLSQLYILNGQYTASGKDLYRQAGKERTKMI